MIAWKISIAMFSVVGLCFLFMAVAAFFGALRTPSWWKRTLLIPMSVGACVVFIVLMSGSGPQRSSMFVWQFSPRATIRTEIDGHRMPHSGNALERHDQKMKKKMDVRQHFPADIVPQRSEDVPSISPTGRPPQPGDIGAPGPPPVTHAVETETAHIRVHAPQPPDRSPTGGWLWNLVTAGLIAAFLYVGYLFLDAGTRGHFTWSLRIFALMAFVVLFAAATILRPAL